MDSRSLTCMYYRGLAPNPIQTAVFQPNGFADTSSYMEHSMDAVGNLFTGSQSPLVRSKADNTALHRHKAPKGSRDSSDEAVIR